MKQFNEKIKKQFDRMQKTGKLFRVDISTSKVWEIYLNSFTTKNIFRDPESSEHNCNYCNNFIRRYGNVVSINSNYEIETMFDVDLDESDEYYPFVQTITKTLKSASVCDVFMETFNFLSIASDQKIKKGDKSFKLGVEQNHKIYTKEEADKFGVVTTGKVYTFNHFSVDLNLSFVDASGQSSESIMGEFRDAKSVFKRGLDEISLDTLMLVKDLIKQDSLLNGTAYLDKLERFIEFKREYLLVPLDKRNNYCWVKSYRLPYAKFRNELVGTLCVELTEGTELNVACLNWNKRADPINYMKAKAPITAKQIKEAEKFVEEGGYAESFDRRHATIHDINVDEILHTNIGKDKIKTAGLFDSVKPSVSTQHKRSQFDTVEEVSIEKFMSDILPTCTSVEAFLENRFEGNMVSLVTANNKDSKPIFKWTNNFSWTYNGNLTGRSQMAQMVEAKGGRTDGVFRFTHSWNELEPNQSLMDLHVFMPGNSHIQDGFFDAYGKGRRVGWNNRIDRDSGGSQDVDYTSEAPKGYIPVENITFPDISKMPEGQYICKIHNWSFRRTGGRGKAEIAFEGNIYQYEYPATKHKEWVTVAIVTLKGGRFSIEHKLPLAAESTKEIYGLQTGEFHKVNLVCLSPNFWGENNVGNKHYFFMLDNCSTNKDIRSFHNEYLVGDLLQHRKVLEVLANSTLIPPAKKQLSGLGFNSTVRDEIILKLKGSFQRTIKVKF